MMRMYFPIRRLFLCLLFLACAVVGDNAFAGELNYSNPIINLKYSTPDVCVWEKSGTYYLFHTAYFNRLRILESSNLVDWKDSGKDAFDKGTLDLLRRYMKDHGVKDCYGGCESFWAPHVVKIKDKWNIYFSLANKGGIFVLQSDSAAGPFRFTGEPIALVDHQMMGWAYDAIDPFVVEEDGRVWLFFGSSFGIYRHQLSDDGLNLAPGDSFALVVGPTDPKQLVDGKAHGGYEGVFLYKYEGYWYCIVSKRKDYSLYVGRNKSITGDFVDADGKRLIDGYGTRMNVPTEKYPGPGHNGAIIRDKFDHYYIFYHAWTKDKKGHYDMRKTMLSELVWEKGFPHILGYKLEEINNRLPLLK